MRDIALDQDRSYSAGFKRLLIYPQTTSVDLEAEISETTQEFCVKVSILHVSMRHGSWSLLLQ